MMLAKELSGEHIGMTVEASFANRRKPKSKGKGKGQFAEGHTQRIEVAQVYHSANLVLVNGGMHYLRPDDEVTVIPEGEVAPAVSGA